MDDFLQSLGFEKPKKVKPLPKNSDSFSIPVTPTKKRDKSKEKKKVKQINPEKEARRLETERIETANRERNKKNKEQFKNRLESMRKPGYSAIFVTKEGLHMRRVTSKKERINEFKKEFKLKKVGDQELTHLGMIKLIFKRKTKKYAVSPGVYNLPKELIEKLLSYKE